jgi:hypothetical protein
MWISLLVAPLLAVSTAGCEPLGTCFVECTTESGGLNEHGPWEDYTEAECEDAAEIETTIFQECVSNWEAY